MAMHIRSVIVLLAVVVVAAAVGCGGEPPGPTPNIDATEEARAKELDAEQVNNLPPDPDLAPDYYDRGGTLFEYR